MSPLFYSTFNHSDRESMKKGENMNPELYHHQQQQLSYGLTKYCSAPSSFFASLVDSGGDGCDDFLNPQSSSSESETMFATFMSTSGSGDSDSQDVKVSVSHQNGYSTSASQLNYQTPLDYDLANHNPGSAHTTLDSSYKVENGRNCSNLLRQTSSPAGHFAALNVENGRFTMTKDVGNGTNFLSGPPSCSRFMPQISENGNGRAGAGSLEYGHLKSSNRCYVPDFSNESWTQSTFTSLQRNKESDCGKIFSSFNATETQNGDPRNHTCGLTHHVSLPKTSSEKAAIEKFLQFQQDSSALKVRAKRGCATHPRSIAERVRRTRISERMKKLQEIFPNMDKQTNTADMLDLAVENIKDLQKQVKKLTDTRAKCICSSKWK